MEVDAPLATHVEAHHLASSLTLDSTSIGLSRFSGSYLRNLETKLMASSGVPFGKTCAGGKRVKRRAKWVKRCANVGKAVCQVGKAVCQAG